MVLAPWQQPTPITPAVTVLPSPPTVVVQSVETEDPDSSVIVFSNPDAETVVWVFGLERTEI
jgi:hypothetical protein